MVLVEEATNVVAVKLDLSGILSSFITLVKVCSSYSLKMKRQESILPKGIPPPEIILFAYIFAIGPAKQMPLVLSFLLWWMLSSEGF
jgi:hypothetical protein